MGFSYINSRCFTPNLSLEHSQFNSNLYFLQIKIQDPNNGGRKISNQEDDSSPNITGVELFVKDVDPRISEQRLFNEFLPFGDIISFKLMMENGRSKGYGYVTYSNEAEAKTAISELNGKILGTKVLFIALSKSKEELARLKNRRNWTRKPCYKKDTKRFWPQRH
ncbi:polyadenylate-binding protein 1-A-like [Hemibagrus wyckioides]|uniref:polyadenylate-binding protein 1-A-like n=1 Tax=Hemibagrus wyckioides TaxID=337641 RepID=UPI00266CFF5A|nr:polyadenylate-binding protein 1-A-like [Hemibagrus wyckioides]